jgi:hypothetical protein
MVAEDIRDLQGGASHDRRGLCRRLVLRSQRREPNGDSGQLNECGPLRPIQ